MPKTEVPIINKLGLHARASAKLARLANTFASEVWLERDGRRVSAKSVMGLMMLAAAQSATLTIETVGKDADEAMARIVELIADRFGEEE
ncbi:MAG: HPr family phosphocarrier protein [Betaproteobacteria bacterium]|jgi:phosphocarrier protein|nr:HPr family phosphocarrier protein [Betaproteobacteria bacterium]